ncbi:endoplasmic reticulum metallopeptidase 1-like [Gigantopelta aegis]|uniref:endoplasmic reticulum metallopeptidase 1-like n=1 Tax=Gigantopelta aegis TaxID=1735272 RepID=UPI001B888381|nr:endoplasmic reticulum metallopeptidase 1-like [Gigantopelta aegis]
MDPLRQRRFLSLDNRNGTSYNNSSTWNGLMSNGEHDKKKPATQLDGCLVFLIVAVFYCSIVGLINIRVHSYPAPKTVVDSLKTDFVEERAREHLDRITSVGARVVGSAAISQAERYIVSVLKLISQGSSPANVVDMDIQRVGGSLALDFIGMGEFTNVYENITNVIAKLSPREPASHSVLINCHFDTVTDSPGASDSAVSCCLMLEILRALSQRDTPLTHNVIFLFNGAEEDILQASHGFITKHPWARSIGAFVNLDSAGAGGWEIVFQTGPEHPWLVRAYASSAVYPCGSVFSQEIFQSGLVPSDTDYRIFRDFGNIAGLDIAHIQNGFVYHTKNDVADMVAAGCMQRGGENVMSLLTTLASSPQVVHPREEKHGNMVFYDVVGFFMVYYPHNVAVIINWSVVVLMLVFCAKKVSLSKGGFYLLKLLGAVLGIVLTWLVVVACVLMVAVTVTTMGRDMSWFTVMHNIVWLYLLPGAAGGLAFHLLLKHTVYKASKYLLLGAVGGLAFHLLLKHTVYKASICYWGLWAGWRSTSYSNTLCTRQVSVIGGCGRAGVPPATQTHCVQGKYLLLGAVGGLVFHLLLKHTVYKASILLGLRGGGGAGVPPPTQTHCVQGKYLLLGAVGGLVFHLLLKHTVYKASICYWGLWAGWCSTSYSNTLCTRQVSVIGGCGRAGVPPATQTHCVQGKYLLLGAVGGLVFHLLLKHTVYKASICYWGLWAGWCSTSYSNTLCTRQVSVIGGCGRAGVPPPTQTHCVQGKYLLLGAVGGLVFHLLLKHTVYKASKYLLLGAVGGLAFHLLLKHTVYKASICYWGLWAGWRSTSYSNTLCTRQVSVIGGCGRAGVPPATQTHCVQGKYLLLGAVGGLVFHLLLKHTVYKASKYLLLGAVGGLAFHLLLKHTVYKASICYWGLWAGWRSTSYSNTLCTRQVSVIGGCGRAGVPPATQTHCVQGKYLLLGAVGGLVFHLLLKHTVYKHSDVWQVESLYFEANLLVWTVVLALFTYNGIMSAYIALLWVICPVFIRSVLTKLLTNGSPANTQGVVAVSLMTVLIPAVYTLYLTITIFQLFTPIMGRLPAVMPDLPISIMSAFSVILCISPHIGLVYISRRMSQVVVAMVTISLVGIAAVFLTPLGFPFTADRVVSSQQRAMFLHIDRRFHNIDREYKNASSIWYIPFDYHGIKSIEKYAPEVFKDAFPVRCEGAYCGRPYTLPVVSMYQPGHCVDVPAPPLNLTDRFSIKSLKKEQLSSDTVRLTLEVTGPNHRSCYISPRSGVSLKRWSMGSGYPKPSKTEPIFNQTTYFLYYAHGEGPPRVWEFFVEFHVDRRRSKSEPIVDIAFSGHYLHGEKKVTPALLSFTEKLPPWTVFVSWVATYDMYQF